MAPHRRYPIGFSLVGQRTYGCSVRTVSDHTTVVRLLSSPYFHENNIITSPAFCFAITVDSLGGDLFWSGGASLITHLPRKPHWPVKAHAFLNAGQLEPLKRHEDGGVGSSMRSSISAALSQPSVSAGVGLIYHFDPVRVELNFGVPLAARASDGTRKGVQVGIGLEFL
jgi:outer membrane protein assembly factor BamA